MEWLIIDGIGPFFRDHGKKRVNWSKVPFAHVEKHGLLKGAKADRLVADFECVARSAADAGYNAVTLDDLAHLADWDGYPEELRARVAEYRALYTRLFEVAERHTLRVLLTSDAMFYCESLNEALRSFEATTQWLAARIDEVFRDYPQVRGLVVRIGEHDAIGTKGLFRSRLLIRTPAQARRFILDLLPVFRRHDRHLVFRTWTVGAYAIGDLIWHRGTFRRVFGGLDGGHLIVSMKYGESDFFRYLPLNRHFFRTSLPTIVEFQARREYEGFGEYPSFVGWEYERYLRELRDAGSLIGASVWCQTGGWSKFRRLTYIERSSVWVELNTFVTAALCRGSTCEEGVRAYCEAHLPDADPDALLVFLTLSDDVIRDLLYVRQFAEQKLFFRRLRVPPLLFTYWDRIVVNGVIRRALRHMVDNHRLCIDEGFTALRKLDLMRRLAAEHGLPTQGLDLQRDTFQLLASLRLHIFRDYDPVLVARLAALGTAYRETWKPAYSLKLDLDPGRPARLRLGWFRRLFLRKTRGYRVIDSVFTLRLLSYLYPLLAPWRRRSLPKFVKKQAMGLDAIFK